MNAASLPDASHELRTPLTAALTGNVDFVAGHGANPEAASKISSRVRNACAACSVHHLLALEREDGAERAASSRPGTAVEGRRWAIADRDHRDARSPCPASPRCCAWRLQGPSLTTPRRTVPVGGTVSVALACSRQRPGPLGYRPGLRADRPVKLGMHSTASAMRLRCRTPAWLWSGPGHRRGHGESAARRHCRGGGLGDYNCDTDQPGGDASCRPAYRP